ncbi:MAG: GNAT family N-acetyltransferase [Magnetococcales bacterium]|nr:GNAT family N-acetyltransferase [Magnetococcales bacterium]
MNTSSDIQIIHLCDIPWAANILAKWFMEEWRPWYGPNGKGDAQSDLASCCDKDRLPICIVALSSETEEVLGTAALKTESTGSELGVGPWLGALLVSKEYRGRGIGSSLIKSIEMEALRLGFSSIYSSMDSTASILDRRRWQKFSQAESLRGKVVVYRFETGLDSISQNGQLGATPSTD